MLDLIQYIHTVHSTKSAHSSEDVGVESQLSFSASKTSGEFPRAWCSADDDPWDSSDQT